MKRLVVGILLLALGVFLVFNNLGWVDSTIYHWIISWQSLIIAIGLILLFDNNQSGKEAGAIMIVIGLLFLIPRVFDIPGIRHFIFPVIIIGAGLVFLIRSTKKGGKDNIFGNGVEDFANEFREDFRKDWDKSWKASFSSIGEDGQPDLKNVNGGLVKREYVFSGTKEKWYYTRVKKIAIEAIFSSVEVDLSQIEFLEEAKTVHIKISSVFSGIKLFIPADWNSVVQKTGVFGGFVDNRPPYMNSDNGGQTVIIEVEAVFGGGEIRYYE